MEEICDIRADLISEEYKEGARAFQGEIALLRDLMLPPTISPQNDMALEFDDYNANNG